MKIKSLHWQGLIAHGYDTMFEIQHQKGVYDVYLDDNIYPNISFKTLLGAKNWCEEKHKTWLQETIDSWIEEGEINEILSKSLRTIANHLDIELPDLTGLPEPDIDKKICGLTCQIIDKIDIKIDDAFENGVISGREEL